jgi:hypothetical protein
MVQHRDGSGLRASWNRHKMGRDSMSNTCYRKTLEKAISYHLLSPIGSLCQSEPLCCLSIESIYSFV